MLWIGLRNQGIQCFPDGDRVLCKGPNGLVLASFPFDEVLVYTKNAGLAEMLRQGLDETDRPSTAQPMRSINESN